MLPGPAEFPEFYAAAIRDIEDNFRDNLKRGFNNEGVRLQNLQKNKRISLDDIAYSADGVYMSLKNLHMTTYPEFRVKQFDVDLENTCILVRFYLGQLDFLGDMQIVNKTMFKNLPMVVNKKVHINISGVTAVGSIGLFPVQDSFVPKNYYIEYGFDFGEMEENEIQPNLYSKSERSTFTNEEMSPITVISTDLHQKLNGILHRQLADVIDEYSINELLIDEDDEIKAYKDYLTKGSIQANRVIDNLIDKAQSMGMFKDAELPTEFLLSYKRALSCSRHAMCAAGVIGGFATITRPADWSLHQDKNERTYYGYVSVKDFKFVYNYSTDYMGNRTEGRIRATIYKNRFSVKLTFAKGEDSIIKMDVFELNYNGNYTARTDTGESWNVISATSNRLIHLSEVISSSGTVSRFTDASSCRTLCMLLRKAGLKLHEKNIWQCGGTLEILPCSHVGHVFRNVSPHSFPGGMHKVISHNLGRVAEVWMDEWKHLFFASRPNFQEEDVGDVSSRKELRDRLECKNFSWYLENVYPDSQFPYDYYYLGDIKNVESGNCLDTLGNKKGGDIGVHKCNYQGGNQLFLLTKRNEIINNDACLDGSENGLKLEQCHGLGWNQGWKYNKNDKTIRQVSSKLCLEEPEGSDARFPVMKPCEPFKAAQQWSMNNKFVWQAPTHSESYK